MADQVLGRKSSPILIGDGFGANNSSKKKKRSPAKLLERNLKVESQSDAQPFSQPTLMQFGVQRTFVTLSSDDEDAPVSRKHSSDGKDGTNGNKMPVTMSNTGHVHRHAPIPVPSQFDASLTKEEDEEDNGRTKSTHEYKSVTHPSQAVFVIID
eukprot:GFYU01015373.1.p1 GENE.GFYU01015373.1~~GFYU01015373.1.p1  ORF type:complete len:172 (-),score=24.87 GFYU01015373.1:72-533(-)